MTLDSLRGYSKLQEQYCHGLLMIYSGQKQARFMLGFMRIFHMIPWFRVCVKRCFLLTDCNLNFVLDRSLEIWLWRKHLIVLVAPLDDHKMPFAGW